MRRWLALVMVLLFALQSGAALARTAMPCCAGDCDGPMLCLHQGCTSCPAVAEALPAPDATGVPRAAPARPTPAATPLLAGPPPSIWRPPW